MKVKKYLKAGAVPNRLTLDEQKNPQKVIGEFFQTYHPFDFRSELWNLLSAGLAAGSGHYDTGPERARVLFFVENMEKLMEANFVLLVKEGNEMKAK